jgi:dynein heavy chain
LKKWVKILRRNQRNTVKAQLNEKLFIANPYFQRVIRQHKEYALEIEGLRFVEIGQLYQLEVQSLEDFKANQEKQRAETVAKLQEYSEKLHDNARGGIKKILEKLKDHIIDEMANDEDKGQDELRDIQEAKNQLNNNKNVFETLGFPEFMNYGHRSMLRRECQRFLRLAYLLDFMTVEALGNMYVYSAQDMVTKFKELCDVYEAGPRVCKFPIKQYTEPIFSINIAIAIDEVDQRYITQEPVGIEIKEVEDFDLECFSQYEVSNHCQNYN